MVPLRIVIITKTDPLKKSLPKFAQPGAGWQGFPNEKVKCKSINRSQINQRLPDAPVYLDPVGQFLAADTIKGQKYFLNLPDLFQVRMSLY